jgi:excisionase family DNA binding protein
MKDRNEIIAEAVTAEEARHCLRLGRNSIYGLLRSGELKGKRIGRKWIIPRAEIRRWLGVSDTGESAKPVEVAE